MLARRSYFYYEEEPYLIKAGISRRIYAAVYYQLDNYGVLFCSCRAVS